MNLLLSLAFVLCWSSGFIGAKLGAGSAPATTVLMWRFLPLIILLLAFSATRASTLRRRLTWRVVGRQSLIGLLSQSGYLLTVYYAIQLGVPSGTTALIDGVQPLVAGALAGPLLRQTVAPRQWLGLCLGAAGVAAVTTADASAGTAETWWAYLIPFLGMFSLVAATFLENRSRTPVAASTSMTIHSLTSAVLFTALAVGTGTTAPPADVTFWVAVIWLVALPTFGGYGLYWLILKRSGVTRVNALMFLMAPVTVVWGVLMFGEPLSLQTVLGLAVALTAVAVVHRGGHASGRTAGTADAAQEEPFRTPADPPGPTNQTLVTQHLAK
ncbi:DMT family transporter [Streptomyces sp. NPDC046978]|uniref:DMT family transporter n=1 Tax=Streptomyces sp. NPDC046978 TaxID=3154704 RepID=UPI003402B3AF